MDFDYAFGATPLDQDEIEGLIPTHITTKVDLDEWEASNIRQAEIWLTRTKQKNILSLDFLKLLHSKMFNKTWSWAGKFRLSEKNIGVAPYQISSRLKNLLDDVISQLAFNSFQLDEIAYRFHFRLVQIHPFPNGNGRHGRLMTDFLLLKNGSTPFTWGSRSLTNQSKTRDAYINALRKADRHEYSYLAEFVRS